MLPLPNAALPTDEIKILAVRYRGAARSGDLVLHFRDEHRASLDLPSKQAGTNIQTKCVVQNE